MRKNNFDLTDIFEGYIRNYRRLNIHESNNKSMVTQREIDYFANLGEMLGFFAFVEDTKPDLERKRSRPMDLAWWKADEREDKGNFLYLALHLERENLYDKDIETIDKLFSKTEEDFIPHNVIGIQNVPDASHVRELNDIVFDRNKVQQSNVLMVYRFYDKEANCDRVWGYHFTGQKKPVARKAIAKIDNMGYWAMCFEEEYRG